MLIFFDRNFSGNAMSHQAKDCEIQVQSDEGYFAHVDQLFLSLEFTFRNANSSTPLCRGGRSRGNRRIRYLLELGTGISFWSPCTQARGHRAWLARGSLRSGTAMMMPKAWEEGVAILVRLALLASPWALEFNTQSAPTPRAR